MKNWVKAKLGITALEEENKHLKIEMSSHRQFVASKVSELKEYTRVDADIGCRGNNTIVLTGVYHNKAFVQFYDIGNSEFVRLVEQLKSMQDHCLIRNIDKPLAFHGVFPI